MIGSLAARATQGEHSLVRLGSSPPCHTIVAVAYDEELADRIRDLVAASPT
jgi:hypothetical protein